MTSDRRDGAARTKGLHIEGSFLVVLGTPPVSLSTGWYACTDPLRDRRC